MIGRITLLIDKYTSGTATPAEEEELASLLEEPSGDQAARDYLIQQLQQMPLLPEHDEARWQAIRDAIHRMDKEDTPVKKRMPLIRWAAAAVLIGGIVAWYLNKQKKADRTEPAIAVQYDRPPGGNVALLTLADGSTIALDSTHDGVIAQQGNTKIAKLGNGQLAYKKADDKEGTGIPVHNTLTTPRGGQYRLILPDGTAVWLNAASSITYPTAFTGNERTVQIAGEAYFEVQKDKSRPFRVKFNAGADSGVIEVLGTDFNINAYTDEDAVRTTLLEGSVRVVSREATLLKPGQQVQMDSKGYTKLIPDADVEDAIAWKNGRFHFENADIQTVMRQIARWYNVEVIFEGKITTAKFEGDIPRSSQLTEVFKILELSKVHFKIDDKKVTVMP
jgi:ferric-dicitrate binding protein FerR (iron transport regulator)